MWGRDASQNNLKLKDCLIMHACMIVCQILVFLSKDTNDQGKDYFVCRLLVYICTYSHYPLHTHTHTNHTHLQHNSLWQGMQLRQYICCMFSWWTSHNGSMWVIHVGSCEHGTSEGRSQQCKWMNKWSIIRYILECMENILFHTNAYAIKNILMFFFSLHVSP